MTFDAYSSSNDDNCWFKPGLPWNIIGFFFCIFKGLLGNSGSTSKSDKIDVNTTAHQTEVPMSYSNLPPPCPGQAPAPMHEVYEQVKQLFRGAPDLLAEFMQFLPGNSGTGNQLPVASQSGLLGVPSTSSSPSDQPNNILCQLRCCCWSPIWILQ
ncbi:hypothetical protein PPACK8108_LOCUS15681 [Phakopsora pachyrhizi]|uniref:Uncharacterized protein n=1 Tax=Phakopsora pachyrhizi TaxID=170000 RepID=A0AAV0B908_PHAPC|nr:hypothetical protein PPACK8108_LOCUS15681 [Phakopsora pachyrhizi]